MSMIEALSDALIGNGVVKMRELDDSEIEETHTISADIYNWIIFKGTKVVDIGVGDDYAGCACSSCGSERYDKERKEILCKAKDSCCNSVLRKIESNGSKTAKIDYCNMKINDILADEADRTKKKNAVLIDRIEAMKEEREKLREEIENLRKEKNRWEDNYYRAQMNLIDERNNRE